MDLEQLNEEHRLEIAHFLGLEGDAAVLHAGSPDLLNTALTYVFHNEQSYAAPIEGQDILDPDAPSPRSEWADMARRAIARNPAPDDSALLLQTIGSFYGRPFTIDAEISDEEIVFLQGILADFDSGLTASASVSQFNAAATAAAAAAAAQAAAAAEAAAAEWSGAQGEMQVLARMAALGHIDPSEIAGGFQPEHAQILHDIIDHPNTFRMMPPANVPAGGYVQALYQRTLGDNMTLRVEGGLEITAHHMDGIDFSNIITDALDPNATPAQVQMAQGVLGVEITTDGSWTLNSLNAAQTYLEAPQEGGVPDSFYSEQLGVASTSYITRALRDGSMNMPAAADLDSIAAGLSSADLNTQATAVATWLSNPANHEAYARMVATQELTAEETSALEAARVAVETRIQNETIIANAQLSVATNNPFAAAPDSALARTVGVIGDERDGIATLTGPEAAIQAVASAVINSSYTEEGQIALHDLTAVMVDLYEVDEGGNTGPLGDATSAELLDNMLMHASSDGADLYDGDELDLTTAEGIQDMLYVTLYATDASDGGNKIYTLTRGEDGHFILGGAPQELLDQVNSVAARLAGSGEGPAAPAPEGVDPAPAVSSDATFIGASLPVVGETDVANLGIDADVLEGIDPTELSLASLSYRLIDLDRFDAIDLESVSLRDIMTMENMGASWSDLVYGSEYMMGDRTVLDTVLQNGMTIEDAAARAGIDPDAPLNLENFGDLAKMTEAIVYATHGETVGPFSADQLLNGSFLSLEGEVRPADEMPDPEESLLSSHDCATCTGAFTVAALGLPASTMRPEHGARIADRDIGINRSGGLQQFGVA